MDETHPEVHLLSDAPSGCTGYSKAVPGRPINILMGISLSPASGAGGRSRGLLPAPYV